MSKVLTANEVLKALTLLNNDIDEYDIHKRFVEALSQVLEDYAGGEFSQVTDAEFGNEMFVTFLINDCVPPDGGVYKHFDTDVTWKNGKEI
jgi:hypothetical protein